jgi:hypothetical protein
MEKTFERKYTDDDGTISIWKYDENIFKNGPISVEYSYPKNIKNIRLIGWNRCWH